MAKNVSRWIVVLLALLVLGPLAAWFTGLLRGPTGGENATLLASSSPIGGFLAGLTAIAIATLFGCVVSRLLSLKAGLNAAGLILAWASWPLGTFESVVREHRAPGVLITLGIEGLIVGALGIASIVAIVAAGRVHLTKAIVGPDLDLRSEKSLARSLVQSLATRDFLAAAGIALAAGAALAWVVAFESLKGQSLMAAVAAGIAAGAAGQLASQSFGRPATPVIPAAALGLLAFLGPLVGFAFAGGNFLTDAYAGNFFPLAVPNSLNWVAGMLLGGPVGLAWAGSMIEKHEVGGSQTNPARS
ncbi:MAG: hypothetical protein SFZ23_11660 [Planctomycetota bacterium]|nr:hypothetical protein [Planctomycetota bacterium]